MTRRPRATGVWGVSKATVTRFLDDQMTDRAAGLTYYSLMSLFPALLVAVSMFGLLGQRSTITAVTDYLGRHGAGASTVDTVRSALSNGIAGSSAIPLVIGVTVALYGASGAFGAAGRALNLVTHTSDDRGFVRRKLVDLSATAVVIVLAALALVLVFVGGGVARELFDTLGLGSAGAAIWDIARWPVAAAVVMAIYAIVYHWGPDVHEQPFQLISPGAVAGVVIWIAASAGFFVYVSSFGSYNKTYGAVAGVVILLVWLWLTNVAMLLGAELNAVLESPGRSARADRDTAHP